ncbi:MAG: Crp/Fnr family transcriptional regulator [Candidatus Binatia bacterium]
MPLIAALEHFSWPGKAAADLARGAHVVPYEKNSIIFHAGEAADLVYVLLGGEVRLQFGPDENGLLVAIAQRGEMLGVFAPDDGIGPLCRSEQLFTASALSRSTVAILPTARVAQVLRELPAAQLVRVLERGRERWTHLSCRLLTYLTMSVRERLVHAMNEMAEAFGTGHASGRRIALRLSHDDLAALVGASRPIVSKHLKELTRQGVLSKHQGRYVLHETPPPPAIVARPAPARSGGLAGANPAASAARASAAAPEPWAHHRQERMKDPR